MSEPALRLRDVARQVDDGANVLTILDGVDLTLAAGDSLALTGASGSGKSTLLQLAAGLDRPDRGRIELLGHDLGQLSGSALTRLRRTHLGFVFQQFNLLPGLSVRDNLLFQRRLNGLPDEDPWITRLTGALELTPLLARPVERLSGGEQQRVAIARALAHRPRLIFADEPTGNLHDELSHQVMTLFGELVDQADCALLLVTHSRRMASYAGHHRHLKGGRLHAVAAHPA